MYTHPCHLEFVPGTIKVSHFQSFSSNDTGSGNNSRDPLYSNGLILILAWIDNQIPSKVWDDFSFSIPKLWRCDDWSLGMGYLISHPLMNKSTYPCWEQSSIMLLEKPLWNTKIPLSFIAITLVDDDLVTQARCWNQQAIVLTYFSRNISIYVYYKLRNFHCKRKGDKSTSFHTKKRNGKFRLHWRAYGSAQYVNWTNIFRKT